MPPFGLYKIPQHHLYGDSPPARRHVYNTMDFQDNEQQPKPSKAVIDEAAHIGNGMANAEHKKKDKKKKRSMEASAVHQMNSLPGTSTASANASTPQLSGGEHKNSKKKKDKSVNGVDDPGKKRKRDSGPDDQPHQDGKAEDGDCGSGIMAVQPESENAPTRVTDSSSKKRKKDKRRESASAKHTITAGLDVSNKATKDKAGKQQESLSTKTVSSQSKAPTAISSPYATTPRKTPVPLPPPQKSSLRASSTAGYPHQPHTPLGGGYSEVLVSETPPSQMPRLASGGWQMPIPFSLSAPQSVTAKDAIEHEVPALTTANLRRTQPLNNKSKPRPSGRAASVSSVSSMSIKDAFDRIGKPSPISVPDFDPFFAPGIKVKTKKPGAQNEATGHAFQVASGTSQVTANLTTEMGHLRAHLRSKAMNDAAGPLPCLKNATGCSSKSEQVLQLMREDDSNTVKITVCSDAEQVAFDLSVAAALEAERFLNNAIIAGIPIPLGKLEGVYSLYCPRYSSTHIDKYGYGQRTLSIQRPSGFTVANHMYTARLSIPPRPMAFTISAFSAPPHASFRSTTLTTSAEGYAMGLTCFGNGYVMLTMDLGLLLTGKKSERIGKQGEVCMEFLGMREKDVDGVGAVKWSAVEEKVGKEVEAMKASEKGGSGNDVHTHVDVSPMKKRGRPTNAERERRAQEAASSQRSSQH